MAENSEASTETPLPILVADNGRGREPRRSGDRIRRRPRLSIRIIEIAAGGKFGAEHPKKVRRHLREVNLLRRAVLRRNHPEERGYAGHILENRLSGFA